MKLATQHGFHTILARIVGGHEASIALHRAVGFEVVGIEREVGRKFGRWLDVDGHAAPAVKQIGFRGHQTNR